MPSWRPLLDGKLCERALAAAEAAAARLAATPARPGYECSLLLGEPGKALLFAELERLRPGSGWIERAADIVAIAGERIGDFTDEPNLIGGFVGTAWTIEHLREPLGVDADVNDAIDEALLELIDGDLGRFGFELLKGIVGWAVYARERAPSSPAGARLLARVAARLVELAEPDGDGLRWRCPAWMPFVAANAARFAHGCFPVDPAHGALGPIAVLAGAGAGARAPLDAAMRWLQAQRFSEEPRGFRAYAGAPDDGFGWCMGDPGAAGVLGAVAERCGEPVWIEVARETARRAARLAAARANAEGGLCHGLAGVGHILNRGWQRSGDAELAEAARDCFRRALAQPLAGSAALLDGDTGVALALLAAATAHEPAWDRIFLLS